MPQGDVNTIAFALSQRIRRVIRTQATHDTCGGWIIWLDTRDYVHGTYLHLLDSGEVWRFTEYEDSGPDAMCVRPADKELV